MSKWEKIIPHNFWLKKIFTKFLLNVIKSLNQKELIKDLYNNDSQMHEIIIKESSKPIIDIFNFRYKKNSIINQKNIQYTTNLFERKIDLLYYCLLQFKGLIRYLNYHGIEKEEIKKISHYITYKKINKGKYIFRNNEKYDALYGLIKGKIEIRSINSIDYMNIFKNDLMKDNFSNIDFKEEIPFENFMSDCEDDGNSENEIEKEDNKNNQTDLFKNKIKNKKEKNNKKNKKKPKNKFKLKFYYSDNNDNENDSIENLKFINEEELDNQIDQMILLEKIKQIDLTIKYKKKEKKKFKPIKIIKAIQKNQTPNPPFSKEILDKFIRDFENIELILNSGECFGELNLVNKNYINYPIYCVEESDFFILEKEFFKKILLKSFIKSHKHKIRFIADKFPLLKKEMKTSNLLNQVIPTYYEKETLIYSPFDKAEFLYLVYQGECNLILIENAKKKEDYLIETNNRQIISKILIGGIAGFESCINDNNNYENALFVSKKFTLLFKINVNFISQIYPYFKKSIIPLYKEQKKIFNDLNKKKLKVKLNLWLKKKEYDMKLKNVEKNIFEKQKMFSNNKHIHRSCLSCDSNIFNNNNKNKNNNNNNNNKILQKKICNLKLFNEENFKIPINKNYILKNLNTNYSKNHKKENNLKIIHRNCLSSKNSMINIYSNLAKKKKYEKKYHTLNSFSIYNSNSAKSLSNEHIKKRNFFLNHIFKNYRTGKFDLPLVTQILNSDS